ncbi:C-type lectin domain family 4 member D [Chionoecetes opilio]|uniref:C-type lectin domain family 4 member D n=1 Tax=Chionoecetes opilio TaxID=41210 RepID=A0A8J4XVR0_CHIOP|nr:C-type lectin domain family 4 member D [Chionoecetes opilio]
MIRSGLLFFMGTLAVVAARDTNSTRVECQPPFVAVGGRCLHVEHTISGTWHAMRKFCQDLGGDLINLADLNFYGDVILYINSLNLPKKIHYWIGATDEEVEGFWQWTDGTAVRMGTPFWANFGDSNSQMPDGGTDQNCAMLDANMHYYFNDFNCPNVNERPLCQL